MSRMPSRAALGQERVQVALLNRAQPKWVAAAIVDGGGTVMPYGATSIALVWLVTLALLAATASGALTGPWLVAAVIAALVAPAILLRPWAPFALADSCSLSAFQPRLQPE